LLDSLDAERRAELEQVALAHWDKGRQPGGTYVEEREYLLVTGVRH
jgi:hypothetical protein